MTKQNQIIEVKGAKIQLISKNKQDYISLTDMVKSFGDETIIYNWMRNRNTIEFLGIWEQINNPDFKPLEFDRFRGESGVNGEDLKLIKRKAQQFGIRYQTFISELLHRIAHG